MSGKEHKVSDRFKERLASLGDDDTVCAMVIMRHSQPPVEGRPSREERKARLAVVGDEFIEMVAELEPIITAEGGKVLDTKDTLYTITVQAGRSLIEHLSRMDSVEAIIENQLIGSYKSLQ